MTTHDAPPTLDADGLLCALVLAPSTYSRNRFFRMYEDPAMKSVLRRARLVRNLVRQLARADGTSSVAVREDGTVELEIAIDSIGYRRRSMLAAVEHDLVVYLASRVKGSLAVASEDALQAKTRVESAIERLSGSGSVHAGARAVNGIDSVPPPPTDA